MAEVGHGGHFDELRRDDRTEVTAADRSVSVTRPGEAFYRGGILGWAASRVVGSFDLQTESSTA